MDSSWLDVKNKVNQLYKYPKKAESDIKNLLEWYPWFHGQVKTVAKTEPFSGVVEKIVHVALVGTIPILASDSYYPTYHIAIGICVLDSYPVTKPLVYLRQSPSTKFWISNNVDNDWEVSVPHLTFWSPGASDLLGLVEAICQNFREQIEAKRKAVSQAYECLFLEISATEEEFNARIRGLTRVYHPDKGGSHEAFIKFNNYVALIKEARRNASL